MADQTSPEELAALVDTASSEAPNGLVLRVRGLPKVQLHADLVMIVRLSQALSRSRIAALAA
jgi:hypothetical protein